MVNIVTIVGRLEMVTNEDQIFISIIKDNVKVPVNVSKNILDNVKSYCKLNDVVGVKGRLINDDRGQLLLQGDKITFLSSSMKGGDNNDSE